MKKYLLLSWFEGNRGFEWYLEPFVIEAENHLEARQIAKSLVENKRFMVVEFPYEMKTVNSDGFVS